MGVTGQFCPYLFRFTCDEVRLAPCDIISNRFHPSFSSFRVYMCHLRVARSAKDENKVLKVSLLLIVLVEINLHIVSLIEIYDKQR